MDRWVAQREWTRVRRPALPAWGWLLIDVAVVSLATSATGALVTLASEDAGRLVGTLGFLVAVALAAYNFVRTTRPRRQQPADPGA